MTADQVHDSSDVAFIDILRAVADARGDARCISGPGSTSSTWAQFIERVERASAALNALGLGCHRERNELAHHESGQDHLALLMHNSPQCLELMCAAFASRVAPVNVNHRYTADELVDTLNYAHATVVAVHSDYADVLTAALPRLPHVKVVIEVADSGETVISRRTTTSTPQRTPNWSLDTPRPYLVLTGGTTGRPRAVMWRNADAVIECFDAARAPQPVKQFLETLRPDLRTLPCAPLMHGAGQWMAMRTLLAGGSVVIPDHAEHFDAADTWKAIENHGATTVGIVGESFARPLLEQLDSEDFDPHSLNVVLTGGAPLTSATKARILEHLPTVLIVDGFGSSETGGQMSIVSSFGSATSGTFTPRPDRTAVLNERLDTVLQPGDDEIGWLGTTGRLPLGYLNDEHKTAQVFRMIDGVRYSAPGDHAKHLIDGSIEALGREAVCINTGGEKVFAEEVEEAVLRHQSVRDCVVVGVPSDVWGSEVVAVISLNSDDLAAPPLTTSHRQCSISLAISIRKPSLSFTTSDAPRRQSRLPMARAIACPQLTESSALQRQIPRRSLRCSRVVKRGDGALTIRI